MELARKSGMSFQALAEDDSLWPPTMSPDHCSEDAMQIVSQLCPIIVPRLVNNDRLRRET